LKRRVIWNALDLGEVGLRVLETGIGQTVLKRAVIGQQEESFAVQVEAACRIETGQLDEVAQCLPAGSALARELREDPIGFPKPDEPGRRRHSAMVAVSEGAL
jgi:hypothetical protein